MKEYHKIITVYARDPETKFRTVIDEKYATTELKYLKDLEWIFTEKVDGTNIRVTWEHDNVFFGGKTERAQIPTFLYRRLQEIFPVKKFENYSDTSMCLYGEGYGAKIQKGGGSYKADGVDFVLFDVNIGGVWLERHNVRDIANQLGIDIVPTVGSGNLAAAVDFVKAGLLSQWGNFMAEGLVMRPATELQTRLGERVITKIKRKDFGLRRK